MSDESQYTTFDLPESVGAGSISLPAHVTGRMFVAYWDALQAARKKAIDAETPVYPYAVRWPPALVLIQGWGRWDVAGVPAGDLDITGDNVPVPVLMWAGVIVDQYMAPLIDLKNYLGE